MWKSTSITAYLGSATAYLVVGKMNSRIRLTSTKVCVEVEAELLSVAKKQRKQERKWIFYLKTIRKIFTKHDCHYYTSEPISEGNISLQKSVVWHKIDK